MRVTSPATKAESWADAVLLGPPGETPWVGSEGPRFELLEVGGPDPAAMALAVAVLSTCVALSIVLSRFQSASRSPQREAAQELLLAPPVLESPPLVVPQKAEDAKKFPQSAEPVTADPPAPELAEIRPPSAPVQPSRAEPLRPTPFSIESSTTQMNSSEPIPRELMETPPPIVAPARDKTVAIATPPVVPLKNDLQSVKAAGSLAASTILTEAKPKPPTNDPPGASLHNADAHRPASDSLGALPLSQLLEDEAGLAAGLDALPTAQRINLPRVSIRVNAAWFAALAQTRERLYFSITPPQSDGEVLAYVPETRTFELERPERPLWQIQGAERVPELAGLRGAAGRWLGVSPALVGLYTWHPPMLENALRMFVLERMQELHMQLGPRDVVTVRLAAGPSGTMMNLEPIREGAYR